MPAGDGPVAWLVALENRRNRRNRRDQYNRLPLITAVERESLPSQWTAVWRDHAISALLETGKQGRFTILGTHLGTQLRGHRRPRPRRSRVLLRCS
jgi:hypothetical protein